MLCKKNEKSFLRKKNSFFASAVRLSRRLHAVVRGRVHEPRGARSVVRGRRPVGHAARSLRRVRGGAAPHAGGDDGRAVRIDRRGSGPRRQRGHLLRRVQGHGGHRAGGLSHIGARTTPTSTCMFSSPIVRRHEARRPLLCNHN